MMKIMIIITTIITITKSDTEKSRANHDNCSGGRPDSRR